jgi:hypothetical protein
VRKGHGFIAQAYGADLEGQRGNVFLIDEQRRGACAKPNAVDVFGIEPRIRQCTAAGLDDQLVEALLIDELASLTVLFDKSAKCSIVGAYDVDLGHGSASRKKDGGPFSLVWLSRATPNRGCPGWDSGDELVADPVDSGEKLGLGRVHLEFLAQAHDVDVNSAGVGCFVEAPDMLQ